MSRWSLLRIGLLGSAFALATVLVGWWAVPALAAFWALYDGSVHRPAQTAAVAAGLGWGLLLMWTAAEGPVLRLSSMLSGVLGVPGLSLIALTIMFPVGLAWGAGIIADALRTLWSMRSRRA